MLPLSNIENYRDAQGHFSLLLLFYPLLMFTLSLFSHQEALKLRRWAHNFPSPKFLVAVRFLVLESNSFKKKREGGEPCWQVERNSAESSNFLTELESPFLASKDRSFLTYALPATSKFSPYCTREPTLSCVGARTSIFPSLLPIQPFSHSFPDVSGAPTESHSTGCEAVCAPLTSVVSLGASEFFKISWGTLKWEGHSEVRRWECKKGEVKNDMLFEI